MEVTNWGPKGGVRSIGMLSFVFSVNSFLNFFYFNIQISRYPYKSKRSSNIKATCPRSVSYTMLRERLFNVGVHTSRG